MILIAQEPKELSPEVLERAEVLRSALGFELRFLPAVPGVQGEEQLEHLLRRAALPDVALVVLACPSPQREGGQAEKWHTFLRLCSRPVLFVGPRGSRSGVVAASDCSGPAMPVVREAGIVAAALGSRLTLVHNINPLAWRFGECVGLPTSMALADLLAVQLREQLKQTALEGEVVITSETAHARAVLDVAKARDAELLVIGVKPLAVALQRTADAILDEARQSILFIPLPAQSKTLFME